VARVITHGLPVMPSFGKDTTPPMFPGLCSTMSLRVMNLAGFLVDAVKTFWYTVSL